CTQGMLGGLARRPTRLRAFAEPGLPFVAVSGGDLVAGGDPLDRLQLQSLLGALQSMGYTAVAPSRRDLALGAGMPTTTRPAGALPMVAVDIDEDAVGERDLQRMLRIESGPRAVHVPRTTAPS